MGCIFLLEQKIPTDLGDSLKENKSSLLPTNSEQHQVHRGKGVGTRSGAQKLNDLTKPDDSIKVNKSYYDIPTN